MNLEDLNVIVQDLINRGVDPKAKILVDKGSGLEVKLLPAVGVDLFSYKNEREWHRLNFNEKKPLEGHEIAVFIG